MEKPQSVESHGRERSQTLGAGRRFYLPDRFLRGWFVSRDSMSCVLGEKSTREKREEVPIVKNSHTLPSLYRRKLSCSLSPQGSSDIPKFHKGSRAAAQTINLEYIQKISVNYGCSRRNETMRDPIEIEDKKKFYDKATWYQNRIKAAIRSLTYKDGKVPWGEGDSYDKDTSIQELEEELGKRFTIEFSPFDAGRLQGTLMTLEWVMETSELLPLEAD